VLPAARISARHAWKVPAGTVTVSAPVTRNVEFKAAAVAGTTLT
jgi:hypothetical protein